MQKTVLLTNTQKLQTQISLHIYSPAYTTAFYTHNIWATKNYP